MRRAHSVTGLLLTAVAIAAAAASPEVSPNKHAAVASIAEHDGELIELSREIWRFAETALHESQSAELLADYAERQGFEVERGVAGMPTAFVASYGEGAPVIAVLGEYDALPGISQKVATHREAYQEGAAGHGCGHNLFGPASLGAALALKELIEAGSLHGTVRFYGTPAEESVGGKIYMIRESLFDDVDVALAWHPSDEIQSDTESSQAIVDFVVEFRGRTANAAADPWNGRSALDALELFTFAATMVDLFERPELVAAIHAEFEEQAAGVEYEAYIPAGPPPLPTETPQ